MIFKVAFTGNQLKEPLLEVTTYFMPCGFPKEAVGIPNPQSPAKALDP